MIIYLFLMVTLLLTGLFVVFFLARRRQVDVYTELDCQTCNGTDLTISEVNILYSISDYIHEHCPVLSEKLEKNPLPGSTPVQDLHLLLNKILRENNCLTVTNTGNVKTILDTAESNLRLVHSSSGRRLQAL